MDSLRLSGFLLSLISSTITAGTRWPSTTHLSIQCWNILLPEWVFIWMLFFLKTSLFIFSGKNVIFNAQCISASIALLRWCAVKKPFNRTNHSEHKSVLLVSIVHLVQMWATPSTSVSCITNIVRGDTSVVLVNGDEIKKKWTEMIFNCFLFSEWPSAGGQYRRVATKLS